MSKVTLTKKEQQFYCRTRGVGKTMAKITEAIQLVEQSVHLQSGF